MPAEGFVVSYDPAKLEACRSLYPDATEDQEEVEDTDPSLVDLLRKLLPRIPERERDLIDLHYCLHKKQADLATMFGITQAAVSYRIARGIHRIKFLTNSPQLTEEELRRDLPFALKCPVTGVLDPNDVNIMVEMWRTSCQSDVSKKLGLSQGIVRHHFFRSVERLVALTTEDERFKPYADYFSGLSNKNFSVLKAVSLPQWAGKGGDECL